MKKSLIAATLVAIASTGLFAGYLKLYYLNRDLTEPVITADQEHFTASIHSSEKELMAGITATDDVDGDATDSLVVESLRVKDGNLCSVTYAACDSSNNVCKYTREVELTDYTPARFSVVDRLRFPIGTPNSQIISALRAEDCIDGDISDRIRLNGELRDTSLEGMHDYTVSVTNSIQDTVTMPIVVEYYTDSIENRLHYPQIFLSEYLVYVEKGSEFQPKRYLDHVELGSSYYELSSNSGSKVLDPEATGEYRITGEYGQVVSGTLHLSAIHMDSDVDTETPGTYKVTFACTTKDGYFGSVQMTVIVE